MQCMHADIMVRERVSCAPHFQPMFLYRHRNDEDDSQCAQRIESIMYTQNKKNNRKKENGNMVSLSSSPFFCHIASGASARTRHSRCHWPQTHSHFSASVFCAPRASLSNIRSLKVFPIQFCVFISLFGRICHPSSAVAVLAFIDTVSSSSLCRFDRCRHIVFSFLFAHIQFGRIVWWRINCEKKKTQNSKAFALPVDFGSLSKTTLPCNNLRPTRSTCNRWAYRWPAYSAAINRINVSHIRDGTYTYERTHFSYSHRQTLRAELWIDEKMKRKKEKRQTSSLKLEFF